VTVQGFSDEFCTKSLGKKYFQVPGKDGLGNFWIYY